MVGWGLIYVDVGMWLPLSSEWTLRENPVLMQGLGVDVYKGSGLHV